MGLMDWLFGKFDNDIADHAVSLYQDKRGTWNKMSHKDAQRAAESRAEFLQRERGAGKKVHVTRNSYTIQR